MDVTDRDMSKDLRDSGLDIDTATMVWVPFGCPQKEIAIPRDYADLHGLAYTNEDLCWSLDDLLERIPHEGYNKFTLTNESDGSWTCYWDCGCDACSYESSIKIIAVVKTLLWILFLEKEGGES